MSLVEGVHEPDSDNVAESVLDGGVGCRIDEDVPRSGVAVVRVRDRPYEAIGHEVIIEGGVERARIGPSEVRGLPDWALATP